MPLEIYSAGVLLGTIIRARGGVLYVYDARGLPLGTFGDMQAATDALTRKVAA